MIRITDKKDCCGCTACANICTHGAITMQPDALGFVYPKVDEAKCIDCGLCDKVCQFNGNYDCSLNLPKPKAFAVRHYEFDEVMMSRSGAAFVAISDYILEHGGVVYGVGYKDHFRIAHKRAVTKEERDEFRGSKYVQSDLTGIFRLVKDDLKHGLTVLFSGTPCQTSGLNAFVGKKYRENLFLVDIVCHGVGAPFVWKDYLSYLEKEQKDTIQKVNFRDKEYGWSAHVETFGFKHTPRVKRRYPYRFYHSVMFRPSCNHCHFANIKRPSDITLGDLWGWQKIDSSLNADNKGINLLLLNTQKGVEFFDKIKESLKIKCLLDGTYLQPNLINPTKAHFGHDKFERDYLEKGISYIVNHNYDADTLFAKFKSIVKRAKQKLKKGIVAIVGEQGLASGKSLLRKK